ncbi:MAG: fumarylacetoacetate hydrolase family protein, partial [Sulfitobacter sp.]
MKFATYTSDGQTFYGAVTDTGMIALSPDYPQWPTLLDVVQAGALQQISDEAAGKPVTHTDFQYEMVLPNARRILCVGVNFPDRNAEYKDGSEQPKY